MNAQTLPPTNEDHTIAFLKREWPQMLILAAPIVLIAIYWNSIPDTIPTHWNFSGKVNGYSSKAFGVLLLPILNIGIALLLNFLPRLDPKKQIGFSMKPIKALRLAVTAFISILAIVMLAVALGKPVDMALTPGILLPLLFLVIGNYMPQTRPNYFVGVRTPWTLEDPENWRLTHALTGKLWVAASILVLLLELVSPTSWLQYILMPYIIILIVIPLAYSYLIFRKRQSSVQ